MNNPYEREQELFAAALALSGAERGAFLDRTLAGPTAAALRARIDGLLRAHDQADGLDDPAQAVQAQAEVARAMVSTDNLVGMRIGRFKLLERLGEGGCGIVYMAEQEQPVRRRVALKIIKAGMDTSAVVARFEAERQALALMDHPNIARVFDGGATEAGRPYFVMELVRGAPITHYCDQAKLSTADRLKLFVKVCAAVQHAHQKGIIHRDLKPSNILVAENDAVVVPKVIDFGIAKAVTDLRLTDKTLFTRFNDFIGTPVYMSPEQAVLTNVDVDTRSDIYSLGVLLYELLTAHLPFDRVTLERAGLDEARRVVREVDPPRPSLRVSTLSADERTSVAQRRGIEPTKLSLVLRTDLDWIVLRCLEKDRARRYETVSGLAKDIQRHLDNEPVLARPPSAGYQLQKLLRRHKLAVLAGAACFVVLMLGLSFSTWQAIRATHAEREQSRLRAEADAARAHAEGLLGYLLEDFFTELQPLGRVELVGGFAHRLVAYYDRLPAALHNEGTERNRALVKLREGGALLRGLQIEAGAAAIKEAQDVFEKRYAENPGTESGALDLAMALGWQFAFRHQAVNFQVPQKQMIAQFRRARDLVRPYALSAQASARARRIYALALADLGPWQEIEEGIRTCEEARTILRSLGATDGTDWTLTMSYCAVSDAAAQDHITKGRLAEAEQLETEISELTDRMLTARPGDLEALQMRAGSYWTQSDIADRRFHLGAALELGERAMRAMEEFVRFDQKSAVARVGPWFLRLRMSDLYWKLGRVRDSQKVGYAVWEQADALPVGRDWTLPQASYWFWQNAMWRELERGDFESAQRSVAKFTLQAQRLRQLGCGWESYLTEYTETAARFSTYRFPRDRARQFSDAVEDLRRLGVMPRDENIPSYWDGLHGRALLGAAEAGVHLERYAEVEALVRRESQPLPAGDLSLDQGKLFPRLWLALVLARQHKATECAEELKALLGFYREVWSRGDRSGDTVRGLAFALYVQAINEGTDAESRLRRGAALDEATQVLDMLTDEAKQLVSSRMVGDWLMAERARMP